MVKYLSIISNRLSLTNNLQREISDRLQRLNRKIVSADNLENFKMQILDEVAAANANHPRCKQIVAEFWSAEKESYPNTITLSFRSAGIFSFQLQKGEEL